MPLNAQSAPAVAQVDGAHHADKKPPDLLISCSVTRRRSAALQALVSLQGEPDIYDAAPHVRRYSCAIFNGEDTS
jgi:hypothetical protein